MPSSSITASTISGRRVTSIPSQTDPSRHHPVSSPSLFWSLLHHLSLCFYWIVSISSSTSSLINFFLTPHPPSQPHFPDSFIEKVLKKLSIYTIHASFCPRCSWIHSKVVSVPLSFTWNWSWDITNNLYIAKSKGYFFLSAYLNIKLYCAELASPSILEMFSVTLHTFMVFLPPHGLLLLHFISGFPPLCHHQLLEFYRVHSWALLLIYTPSLDVSTTVMLLICYQLHFSLLTKICLYIEDPGSLSTWQFPWISSEHLTFPKSFLSQKTNY